MTEFQAVLSRVSAKYHRDARRKRGSVRMSRHGGAPAADPKVEIATFVGLQYVVDVEATITTVSEQALRLLPSRQTRLQFRF